MPFCFRNKCDTAFVHPRPRVLPRSTRLDAQDLSCIDHTMHLAKDLHSLALTNTTPALRRFEGARERMFQMPPRGYHMKLDSVNFELGQAELPTGF